MDDFTLNLLSNDEVNAINQDAAGKQAIRVIKKDNYQVWVKELEDGSRAVGIFNVGEKYENIRVDWEELGLTGKYSIRDCWRQKDLGTGSNYTGRIPPHGVSLLKISQ
jgi:alpha-galactosidase